MIYGEKAGSSFQVVRDSMHYYKYRGHVSQPNITKKTPTVRAWSFTGPGPLPFFSTKLARTHTDMGELPAGSGIFIPGKRSPLRSM